MTSGVAISDEVVTIYNLIKLRLRGAEEKERYKLVIMRMSDDQKCIIVDHDNCLRNKDVENEADVFKKIISKLPPTECRYALYDCTYENKGLKEDLVFIMWAPDEALMRSKMVYASSKGALKSKLPGLKFEWQVNDCADKDVSSLVEKLGGRGVVKTVEGKKCKTPLDQWFYRPDVQNENVHRNVMFSGMIINLACQVFVFHSTKYSQYNKSVKCCNCFCMYGSSVWHC
ncbi:non-muscle cofilin 1-like [Xyrauchen texanus]|uniref:non-muscle cofilin 1-like n=1 Tax=Xyrauchen texanus TaxID=154827 RepID=UPI0022424CC6|nr:non-muscle cofilin 1-like [Xyrauchen texanus]